MTETEVRELLARTDKTILRAFLWGTEEGRAKGERFSFESSVQVGEELPFSVRFIAKYRASKKITKGSAQVLLPEKFDAGILCSSHRVSALDTNPGTPHTNDVGLGLPYHKQTLWCNTHRHIWVGMYGYAEPVEPPIMDVVELIHRFLSDYNLKLHGEVRHPLLHQTGDLFK